MLGFSWGVTTICHNLMSPFPRLWLSGKLTPCSKTLITLPEKQHVAEFSFRMDFPFDGTSAFLRNDKMYYTVHAILSMFELPTISLSLNIRITVIVRMPHVDLLGGLYHTCVIYPVTK